MTPRKLFKQTVGELLAAMYIIYLCPRTGAPTKLKNKNIWIAAGKEMLILIFPYRTEDDTGFQSTA